MTAAAVIAGIHGPFTWTREDADWSGRIAWILDACREPGTSAQSELVRQSSALLLRGDAPSLLHAWRFCHAARLLSKYESTLAAHARKLGCLIANATLKGSTVIDVKFAEVGASASYIAIEPQRGIESDRDVPVIAWIEREGSPDLRMLALTDLGAAELLARPR